MYQLLLDKCKAKRPWLYRPVQPTMHSPAILLTVQSKITWQILLFPIQCDQKTTKHINPFNNCLWNLKNWNLYQLIVSFFPKSYFLQRGMSYLSLFIMTIYIYTMINDIQQHSLTECIVQSQSILYTHKTNNLYTTVTAIIVYARNFQGEEETISYTCWLQQVQVHVRKRDQTGEAIKNHL